MCTNLTFPEDPSGVYSHPHSHPTLKVCHSGLLSKNPSILLLGDLQGRSGAQVGEARNNRLSPGTYDRRSLPFPSLRHDLRPAYITVHASSVS